jgi:hypothetical protein
LSTGPSYSDSIDVAQYISTEEDPSATATHGQRYVFAPLKKRELSIDTRVNVLFTPKMSVQLYMQPLMVVGDYGDFKSLARPKSFDFDPYPNPVDSPDFNFKSLRVNAIFRWEWRLGSTIYAAWTQQRQDIANSGRFQLGRDLSQVFTGPADNVFLIKISHWLSR